MKREGARPRPTAKGRKRRFHEDRRHLRRRGLTKQAFPLYGSPALTPTSPNNGGQRCLRHKAFALQREQGAPRAPSIRRRQ
eukprot:13965823-Alexandrium_andersonii.AAC.1